METNQGYVNHYDHYPGDHSLSQINTEDLLEDIMQCDTIRYEAAQQTPYQVLAQNNMPVPFNTDHFSRLPDLNELEGLHCFEVTLDGNQSGKTTWIYSSKLEKVFVKINAKISFDVSVSNIHPQSMMFLRVMPVYSDPAELATPVNRCANHKSNDKPIIQDSTETDISSHVLRSNMLKVMFVGQTDGRTYGERLAVRLPLDADQQKIILEFGCQNSCSGINRRTTALLFCLEDAEFNLLGKRIMNFKVCSCPKRDKDKEETDSGCKKRKPGDEPNFCPPGKKPAKVQVKEEPTTPLSSEPETQIDLRPSPSTDHSITIKMYDEEAVKELLKHAFQITAASMVTRSSEVEQIKPILKGLRKQMDDKGCKPK